MSWRSARIQALSSSVAEPEGAGVDCHEEDCVDTARGRTVEWLVASPPRNRTNADLIPHKVSLTMTTLMRTGLRMTFKSDPYQLPLL
ncbi:hypothetical protein Taro_039485 [Colocasia esculenta]|uniref:Uncharacterized protein n=1 Tax=Colocasia esculenta TaxID=4460 RepID=A0A843WFX2_COLES|nr:hypothetical protein [Colocasia esculenta]